MRAATTTAPAAARALLGGALCALLAAPAPARAQDACMVSPTDKKEVSGRFGKFRSGGAANANSGNSRPHMHDGLDFSTSGHAAPLHASAAGTVIYAELRGSAGNTVMIKRDNGDVIAYYHLSSMKVKKGQKVAAGEIIGYAGNTGMNRGGAVHLHFIYGVPNKTDVRAKQFAADANKNKAFNPAQLPNVIGKQNVFNYATDPSPYFCQTFPIQGDGLASILGGDTKAQYAKLFGAAPPMGVAPDSAEPAQVAAANNDALQAQAAGASAVAGVLSDADGFGTLPGAPLGEFETLSPAEMMATEARRRFSDTKWNTDIVRVSSRALWVDYLRALGVSAFMNEAIRLKKERVEALLALYTAQKLALKQARTTAAQQRAARGEVANAIK